MANQSPDRREVLTLLARVAALSQFPGFSRWISAAEHSHPDTVQPRPVSYSLQFFTPAEYRALDQITELIIPRDDSPGARDAGVGEFIDFMVAHDEDLQYPFRSGLTWLNAFAFEKHGKDFPALSADQQAAVLRKLAYKKEQSHLEVQGQDFFKLAREYTVMGYYTSRIGLEQLDNPDLKFYSASPECPHKDDPEHRHLKAGKA